MRDPNELPTVFKRRHFGTPASFTIITTNYVIVAGGLAIFTSHHHIHWFFWVILGLLAVYNAFSLYKNWEDYDKVSLTAYIIGLAGLPLLFLMF
ncbi:MAG: hypothetical protein JST50_20935 [Bacteroidetes bacterium]|jgi:hypothetical protein|nr:hypothetical protein [Bacteroidota bacterium]